MYSQWQLAKKYLHYYITASSRKGHGMHSPFVFEFIANVLNDKAHYAEYDIAEDLREQLLKDQRILTIEDFGAGSATTKSAQRTIASVARNAAKPKKYGQLLYRMVKYYQPDTILELGTSLGITTTYLSLAKPDAKLITMEGSGEVAAVSNTNFKSLGLQNISIEAGNFDNTLSPVVRALSEVEGSSVDLAFIDGNHRQEPTERYFTELLVKTNNASVLIFDDIHWSREMELAWETIKAHPSVRCSIDLFFIGIVLFRHEFREKQHFSIRF
jgi:predicted O-methyltransferase YrrM